MRTEELLARIERLETAIVHLIEVGEAQKEVRANQFTLVDDNRNVRGSFDARKNGAKLELWDENDDCQPAYALPGPCRRASGSQNWPGAGK